MHEAMRREFIIGSLRRIKTIKETSNTMYFDINFIMELFPLDGLSNLFRWAYILHTRLKPRQYFSLRNARYCIIGKCFENSSFANNNSPLCIQISIRIIL